MGRFGPALVFEGSWESGHRDQANGFEGVVSRVRLHRVEIVVEAEDVLRVESVHGGDDDRVGERQAVVPAKQRSASVEVPVGRVDEFESVALQDRVECLDCHPVSGPLVDVVQDLLEDVGRYVARRDLPGIDRFDDRSSLDVVLVACQPGRDEDVRVEEDSRRSVPGISSWSAAASVRSPTSTGSRSENAPYLGLTTSTVSVPSSPTCHRMVSPGSTFDRSRTIAGTVIAKSASTVDSSVGGRRDMSVRPDARAKSEPIGTTTNHNSCTGRVGTNRGRSTDIRVHETKTTRTNPPKEVGFATPRI